MSGVRAKGVEVISRFPWSVSVVAFMANPSVQRDPRALEDSLSALTSDPVFDMVELHYMSEELWKAAEPILRKSRVDVVFGAQPLILNLGYNPSALEEGERRKAVEKLVEVVEVSAARGVKKVAFCSGRDPGAGDREAAKDSLVKSVKEVAVKAKKLGVALILETFDRNWDRRQLIGPLDEAVKVVEEVRNVYDDFGLLWDLSHAPMLDEKPSVLKKASGYLSHIHVGCCKRLPDGRLLDSHPGFYRPGAVNGVEEVAELLKVLLEMGYRGAIGFEVKPEEGQEWREPVEAAKSVLYTAFAKVLTGWPIIS